MRLWAGDIQSNNLEKKISIKDIPICSVYAWISTPTIAGCGNPCHASRLMISTCTHKHKCTRMRTQTRGRAQTIHTRLALGLSESQEPGKQERNSQRKPQKGREGVGVWGEVPLFTARTAAPRPEAPERTGPRDSFGASTPLENV